MSAPKTHTKFIVRPHPVEAFSHRTTNIFRNTDHNQTALGNLTLYSIVGDSDFKRQYYRRHSTVSVSEAKGSTEGLDETINTTFCQFTKSIQNKTLTSKLSRPHELEATRDNRTMMQRKLNSRRNQKIENFLRTRNNKSNFTDTVTFGSVQQIYIHPNPEKDDLINDNIPEYWKNSLRNNEKRLKRHVKGNRFTNYAAEEMLQTLKGRKTLENSIPSIKEEFKFIPCSKKANQGGRRKGFSLVGRRISDVESPRETNSWSINVTNDNPLFGETHKIQYDARHRWKAIEL